MICKKCGSECPDGNIFCEACGAELDAPVLPDNIDDKGRVKKQKAIKPKKAHKQPKEQKPQKEKKIISAEEKAAINKKLKLAGICLAVIAVIIIIAVIVSAVNANKGFNAAQKIPIGRNVEYAESASGLRFSVMSTNGLVNNMSDFDYIYISDETVKVGGSEQPQWAIMLTVGEDDLISTVEYYDFKQLKHNWKGRKMAEMLDKDSLEYGMNVKSISKKLGMKPYYVRRSVSNDSTYCYRYHFSDSVMGFDRAFNYYVEFSDIEQTVRNISYSEIDYAATILAADNIPTDETSAETEADPAAAEDSESENTDEISE